jgi:nucleoside-diphosphate-sugar epimerase
MIYGPDGELYTPLVGLSVGSTYIVIGSGREVLPLVNIIDLVHAILLSMTKDEAVGQIFNVVDPEPLDKRTYMDRVIRALDPEARVVYFPYSLLYGITWLQERLFALMNRTPVVSCYRLVSSQKRVRYDSSRVINRLGWTPLVSLEDAVEQLVRSESSGNRSPIRRLQPSASDVVESFETSRRQAGSRSAR